MNERYICLNVFTTYKGYDIVTYYDKRDKCEVYNVNGESDSYWYKISSAKMEINKLIEKEKDTTILQCTKEELELINEAIDEKIINIENDMENGFFIDGDSTKTINTRNTLKMIYNYIYEKKESIR